MFESEAKCKVQLIRFKIHSQCELLLLRIMFALTP